MRSAVNAPETSPAGFDALAARYDAWYTRPIGAWADHYETEAVFRLLALSPGERLLDLGAGTGRYAAMAASQGARVVGMDPSAGMLAVANVRKQEGSRTFVRAGAARLPFRDASFDVTLAVTSLCFTAEPDRVLHEVARVLRPGGRFVLGELNRWSMWAGLRRIEGFVRPTTYRNAHFRGIREWHALLEATGFIPVRWEGVLHLPPVDRAGFLHALDPLERLGQRRCPGIGAFLAMEARRADPS